MSIIILHNLVVFALVVRVLVANHPAHAAVASNLVMFSFSAHIASAVYSPQ